MRANNLRKQLTPYEQVEDVGGASGGDGKRPTRPRPENDKLNDRQNCKERKGGAIFRQASGVGQHASFAACEFIYHATSRWCSHTPEQGSAADYALRWLITGLPFPA